MDRLLNANSSCLSAKRVSLDLLGTIAQLCERHSGFKTVRDRGLLIIYRTDLEGLEIKVYDGGGPTAVVIGPWYGEVSGERAILALIEQAMTGGVRVRIESCRGRDHSWTAEVKTEAGSWTPIRENRIAELWPLHATLVRYLSMPPSIDKRLTAPEAGQAEVARADKPAQSQRMAMPYYAFAQHGARVSAGSHAAALAM